MVALLLPVFAHAMTVYIGTGQLRQVNGNIKTAFLADPDVADIKVPTDHGVLITGRHAGSTTLYVLDGNGNQLLHERVNVRHDLSQMQLALHERFPALDIKLNSQPGSVMVTGSAPDPQTVAAVVRSLKPYLAEGDDLINRLIVSSPTQVYLKVRVVEMSKTITQKLGINWSGIGSASGHFMAGVLSGRDIASAVGSLASDGNGGSQFFGKYSGGKGSVLGLVDLLNKEGLVQVLAEPNLTAVSGQTASFLAGGEFPVPVKQDKDTMTVDFKPFGVALDFTPTVLGDDRISLKVRPEISELDPTASVTMNGLTIPGISVRRVETTVEMSSGQSLAIGGLLKNDVSDVEREIPGVGRIPVLGKLFSSSDYRSGKSELVVIVTPYLVHPIDADQASTPLAALRANSDIEDILANRLNYDPLGKGAPRLTGSAGFVY